MSKKKLAGAILVGTVASAAYAQTNVSIYGSIDAGVRYQTNVNADGDSLLSMGTGNYYSNRLGFRGVEDLGGGLRARFQLESGFSTKTGALDNTNSVLFNRTAAVGLGGEWGYVDFGRQYTIGFRTEQLLDPFNHRYTGIVPLSSGAGTTLPASATAAGLGASASSGTRFNNNIQYTGTFGPVTARAEYASGEVPGDTSRSAAKGVGLAYTGGPLLLAGAYTQKETAAGFDNKAYVVGGGYKFGEFQLKAGLSKEQQDTAASGDLENGIQWLGGVYQMTPALEITAAYYRSKFDSRASEGTRNMAIVGASFALSKRTNLYAEVDVNRYKGALIPTSGQTKQIGISAGVMHLF